MTDARGIVGAAAIAVLATGGYATYRAWPAAYGTEIYVPAAIVRVRSDTRLISVRLPFAQIALDVPHTTPEIAVPFEPVKRIGNWWNDGSGPGAPARRLRGRPLYLQLAQGQPLWSGGPLAMRASTVSDAPVAGEVNVAGIVTAVRDDGFVWIDFSLGSIPVPTEVAVRARPFTPLETRRAVTAPILPATDPGVVAVLRVLPSGRVSLMGVLVAGKRF